MKTFGIIAIIVVVIIVIAVAYYFLIKKGSESKIIGGSVSEPAVLEPGIYKVGEGPFIGCPKPGNNPNPTLAQCSGLTVKTIQPGTYKVGQTASSGEKILTSGIYKVGSSTVVNTETPIGSIQTLTEGTYKVN